MSDVTAAIDQLRHDVEQIENHHATTHRERGHQIGRIVTALRACSTCKPQLNMRPCECPLLLKSSSLKPLADCRPKTRRKTLSSCWNAFGMSRSSSIVRNFVDSTARRRQKSLRWQSANRVLRPRPHRSGLDRQNVRS
jgi:hypothetical protein